MRYDEAICFYRCALLTVLSFFFFHFILMPIAIAYAFCECDGICIDQHSDVTDQWSPVFDDDDCDDDDDDDAMDRGLFS